MRRRSRPQNSPNMTQRTQVHRSWKVMPPERPQHSKIYPPGPIRVPTGVHHVRKPRTLAPDPPENPTPAQPRPSRPTTVDIFNELQTQNTSVAVAGGAG